MLSSSPLPVNIGLCPDRVLLGLLGSPGICRISRFVPVSRHVFFGSFLKKRKGLGRCQGHGFMGTYPLFFFRKGSLEEILDDLQDLRADMEIGCGRQDASYLVIRDGLLRDKLVEDRLREDAIGGDVPLRSIILAEDEQGVP